MMTAKPKRERDRFEVFTLNVGNTHTKLMGWCFSKYCEPKWLSWKTGARIPNIEAFISSTGKPAAPIILAGVIPSYKNLLKARLKRGGRRVLVFRRDIKPRIKIIPKPPARVGDDRIAAALGALHFDAEIPWVVIDIGTAITINAVRPGKNGRPPRFEGGLILPSAAMSLAALNKFTAQLPLLDSREVSKPTATFIGRNTKQAMVQGVFHAQVAAVIALAEGQMKELGPHTGIFLTGGGTFNDAFLRKLLTTFCPCWMPDLVHIGLAKLWRCSRKKHG